MLSFDELPSFLDVGAWTKELILPLFRTFKNENFAPALAFVIFVAALALCTVFILHSSYIRMQISRRTRAVRRIKDRPSFAKAMPEVEALMSKSSYLRHSWEKFRETLIEPLPDEPVNQVIRNTVRPQSYFNMPEAGLRFAIFRVLPNLLVGIGLLLTFFGLVSALYFTTDAIMNAGDLAASQDALRNLLYAASFKFYTSIAGLAGSIILTLTLRYGTSKIEARFDDLAFALERKIVLVTSEWIAVEHFKESKEQTRNLRQFNTDVAISIGKRVEEALTANLPTYLAQAMAPISESLEKVASKVTTMSEGAIGDLAGQFVGKLESSTGEHIKALGETLNELRTSLSDINQRLSNSGDGLARNIADSSRDVREAMVAIGDTATSLKEATAPLAETARLIADASQRMVVATQTAEHSISVAQADIRDVAQALRTSLESTTKQWERYEKRFADVDESLGQILDRIVKSVQDNLDGLSSFVEKIDVKLAVAIDKLGGGIDDLSEFAQRMEQVTTRMNGGTHPTP